jgi:transposase InsO family protein
VYFIESFSKRLLRLVKEACLISKRAKKDKVLSQELKHLFIEHKCRYGARRLAKSLRKLGYTISRRRVGRLMKLMGLVCKTRHEFKHTTDSNHNLMVSPNLLNRDFSPQQAGTIYAGDITYIPTQEGWLYLAVVIDLFSRRVVGWAMNKRMKADLVNKALLMAIWQRKPRRGLISHTDRGSQYASNSHGKILEQHGIEQSMSRRGDCWDNAVSESFFHTLKTELTYHENFKTRAEAEQCISEYIEVYYNRKRMHSTNDYMSPVEYENARKAA